MELPSASLPKGGGAVRGVDEKLLVSLATGAASLSVPVHTSPARGGGGPVLALSYQSSAGNGPFGLGWQLPVPAISRKTASGVPRYDDAADSDTFTLAGAEDLVPALRAAGEDWEEDSFDDPGPDGHDVRRYRPRVEGGFARIERWRARATGEVHWRTVSADNVTSVYGLSAPARIAEPDDENRVFSWLLEHSYDDRGNVVAYEYKAENRDKVTPSAGEASRKAAVNRYPKRIRYGNRSPYYAGDPALPAEWLFEVVFDYGEHDPAVPTPEETGLWDLRPDPFSTYRAGFEIRTRRLCRRILMFHRFPELGEEPLLVRSTDISYEHDQTPADPALPQYSLVAAVTQTGWVRKGNGYETEQMPPLELEYSALALDDTQRFAPADSLENLPGSLATTGQRLVDLEGEGLPGVLTETASAWYYKRNVSAWNPAGDGPSPRFDARQEVALKPAGVATLLTDLDGDGSLDAVSLAPPLAGRFRRDGESWGPFRPFSTAAAIDWSRPDLRLVDLDGDGRADVLTASDDAFAWHRWDGEGFAAAGTEPRPADEDRGPALTLAPRDGSVLIGDMSGDGLADLVRIGNGEVCYWPNLGHGRFGAKVTMDGAPSFDAPERFDPSRLRLADLDGSGPADLVYLGERTRIWFNRSGNSWAEGQEVRGIPAADDCAQVEVADFLGTGTACIVWTSAGPADAPAPLRYVDLTASTKPHLLTRARNNLGAERTLTYAPSTKFYVRDAVEGQPWITRLPFPVHVVERVETTEEVSGTSLVSTYSYHHGHYDGAEREFRGFARVEQTDAEEIPAGPAPLTLPPVRTKTWFHTGYYDDRETLLERLRREFYAGDAEAPRLPPGDLPGAAGGEELGEACRALRGSVLRQEVYAEDRSAAAEHPYTTTEHRYGVRRLQPRAASQNGCFHAWKQEQIVCQYERDPADPRIGHSMTLAIDEFGAVTRTASAAYRRRAGGFPEQERTLLTYEESDVVNVADRRDWYRLGVPLEARSYELTGFEPDSTTGLFDPEALALLAPAAAEIPAEATPPTGQPRRRLLGKQRLTYLSNDLSQPLPHGTVESLGLVERAHSLRYTKGQLAPFAGKLGGAGPLAALLAGPGALVDLDGDGNWWAPSGRTFLSPDPDAPDPAFARAHFYLPQGGRDPWSNLTRVGYDAHNLLVESVSDAFGNVARTANNYRVLGPWLTTDANRNRSGVRYDALGRVIATAAMGKLLPNGEDEGDHLDTATAEPSASDDPTTRLSYDLGATPAWTRTQARVRHKDPATPWTDMYAYSDGLGRTALVKTLAEGTPRRWIGSGRVIYDNKGNAIKAYEPFFDTDPDFTTEPELVEKGVTTVTRYDPLSRAIRVDNPDGTFRTVGFGPWEQVSADENDTCTASGWFAARSAGGLGPHEQEAATKAAAHAGTPTRSQCDSLGRTFRTTQDDGSAELPTTLELDIEGRVRATTDALGRLAMSKDFDVAGGELHQSSPDGGERWLLSDAAGAPLVGWDSRGNQVRHHYDELRRPTDLEVRTGSGPARIAERIAYGESFAGAIEANLLGAVHTQSDEAGVATVQRRDFAGNVVHGSCQLIADEGPVVDWAAPPPLDPETFTTRTRYDALGRAIEATAPDGSVSASTYNERGLLTGVSVKVHGTAPVRQVLAAASYDEQGRRTEVEYGNGVTVRRGYDRDSSRLTRVLATRAGSNEALQDLTYTYDPVGNVTRVGDAAKATLVFAGQVVGAGGDYTYDPLYRLTKASGREHRGVAGASAPSFDDTSRVLPALPADGQALRNYTQAYAHDEVGNLKSVSHTASGGSWTRTYAYDEPNLPPTDNRLTSTTVGTRTERYSYDAHGNLTAIPHLSLIEWDWKDQLRTTASQAVNAGNPETTRYRYDASGARVRKTIVNAAGRRTAQRLYLGPYELYREYGAGGAVSLERQSLHVADGSGRACLLETTVRDTSGAGPLGTLARYQLSDRLGSSVLELDDSAAVVTFEEYHPYGSTALLAGRGAAEVSLKRYRYLGRERDRETGFNHQGARYYAPWLGRWVSPDPAGLIDGPARYTYARGNPISLGDPGGMQSTGDPTAAFPTTSIPMVGVSFGDDGSLWLFQQRSFGQEVTATRSGRGIGRGVRSDLTGMARWWGYGGPVDAGHFDRPFWSLRAGETSLVVPQPRADNRSQGATSDRSNAAAARAAGEFTRTDGVDVDAPTGVRRAQPGKADIYASPSFQLVKPQLLRGGRTGTAPGPTLTLGGEGTGMPSGSTGSAGSAQLEFDFSAPHSPTNATGSPGSSTQTAGMGSGRTGTGTGGEDDGSWYHSEGSVIPRSPGPGSSMFGSRAPDVARMGRTAAAANPVIPEADAAEQFFNDLARSSSMRGNTVLAGVAEFAAAGTAVVASAAASGAIAGHATEATAKALGANSEEAKIQGAWAAIFAGALVGGAIAGPTVIGEPVGIFVGAVVGLTAYLLTRP